VALASRGKQPEFRASVPVLTASEIGTYTFCFVPM
jgi:hypothetical protein